MSKKFVRSHTLICKYISTNNILWLWMFFLSVSRKLNFQIFRTISPEIFFILTAKNLFNAHYKFIFFFITLGTDIVSVFSVATELWLIDFLFNHFSIVIVEKYKKKKIIYKVFEKKLDQNCVSVSYLMYRVLRFSCVYFRAVVFNRCAVAHWCAAINL